PRCRRRRGLGVLECVFQVRKELGRVEELGSLEIVEQTAKPFLRQLTNRLQQGERDVMSNHRRLLQQAFLGGGQGIDTGGEHRPYCGRDLDAREWPRKAVVAAHALQHTGIDQRSHNLFDEERIPAGALHHETLRDRQTGVGAQQSLKEIHKILTREGIQTYLVVIRLVPPFVAKLGAVTDNQQQTSILRGDDQLVQQTESKRVVPVKVLDDRDERLHTA